MSGELRRNEDTDLELMKTGEIQAVQDHPFGDIRIRRAS